MLIYLPLKLMLMSTATKIMNFSCPDIKHYGLLITVSVTIKNSIDETEHRQLHFKIINYYKTVANVLTTV